MKVKKSHDLLSARWRTRKVGGIIWSQSEDLRTRSTSVQKQEMMDVSGQEKGAYSPLLCLFAVFRPSTVQMMPTQITVSHLCFHCHISFSDSDSLSLIRTFVITLGPSEQSLHFKIFNLIISAESLLPCKITYSQVLGIRTCLAKLME